MWVEDFDYDLPSKLIATTPTRRRTGSRLLVVDPTNDTLLHTSFSALPSYLRRGDLLVLNDTKVMRARLLGTKSTGGRAEVFIERVIDTEWAWTRVRTHRPAKPGAIIQLAPGLHLVCIERKGEYTLVRFSGITAMEAMETLGHIPLPPYIARPENPNDNERYQTVYAKSLGAVAAPTAGLHFDEPLLDTLRETGVEIGYLTLHVGSGTFQPLRHPRVECNQLHSEVFVVSPDLCAEVERAKRIGGRVIAVGTTVVRAIEAASLTGELHPVQGETNIFIRPGFGFHTVDAMVTNFHLPKSSLLMLVSAFAGCKRIVTTYEQAVEHQYRFFSYGDAMFIASRGRDQ